MIKLVISGGDSFTFGSELPDDDPADHDPDGNYDIHQSLIGPRGRRHDRDAVDQPRRGSKLSWANLVAVKLNAKHINIAEGGRSNSFIVRHIINKIYEALQHEYKTEEIFVQVMWTFVTRQELVINSDTKRWDSPWFPIDPYVPGDETKSDWFKKIPKDTKNWQSVHDGMYERYLINKELGMVDFVKEYYKVTGSVHDTYISLKEILMLQDFLESRSIKYMFTYVSEHVMYGLGSSDRFTNGLHSFIKFKEWYIFPGDKEFMGFDDWARENKYEYATSHPLEKAHEDTAELIYERVKQIVK